MHPKRSAGAGKAERRRMPLRGMGGAARKAEKEGRYGVAQSQPARGDKINSLSEMMTWKEWPLLDAGNRGAAYAQDTGNFGIVEPFPAHLQSLVTLIWRQLEGTPEMTPGLSGTLAPFGCPFADE